MKSMGELRKFNTRNIIINIIRTRQKASKFQIQKISRYSMTTILSTIDELVSSDLILPAGKGLSNGGRRPDYFAINPQGGFFIGIEFNLLSINATVLNFAGEPVEKLRIVLDGASMTPELLMSHVINTVESLFQPLKAAGARIFGIGVGAPGLIDYQLGVAVRYNDMRSWQNVAIRQIMESRFGVRTYVDNNVNMIALGSQLTKQDHAYPDYVLFSIRKGIRVSCVTNSKLLRGRNNSAGEVGHTPVLRHGRTCVCGRRGCLDAEASNDAIRAKLLEGIQNGRHLDLFEAVGRDPAKVNVAAFVDSVLAGHPDSLELFEELCELLSIGLTHVINFYNPPRIILYGEITRIGQPFLERIRHHVERMAVRFNTEDLTFELADLDYSMGAAGSALMVMQNEFPFVNLF